MKQDKHDGRDDDSVGPSIGFELGMKSCGPEKSQITPNAKCTDRQTDKSTADEEVRYWKQCVKVGPVRRQQERPGTPQKHERRRLPSDGPHEPLLKLPRDGQI